MYSINGVRQGSVYAVHMANLGAGELSLTIFFSKNRIKNGFLWYNVREGKSEDGTRTRSKNSHGDQKNKKGE